MPRLKRCVRCVMPETWAGITFDENGVCNVCREYEKEPSVDWASRQKILEEILEVYRTRAREIKNKWDCVVGLSGGKDSVYTLWAAKKKYSLRPLAVTWDHGIPMCSEAEYNLQTIPKILDVDHLRFTIGNGLRNAMCRKTSETAGDWCYFCHWGVGSFPARISKLFDIPLQLWGEPNVFGGGLYGFDAMEEQNKEHFEKMFTGGTTPEMILPDGYEKRDLLPMMWPDGEFSLKALYLGNFEKWDQRKHVEIITRELGWKRIPSEITYVDWDKCDCKEGEELRDVQKFYRRQLSRVAFQASKDIRDGLLDRSEAMRLVEKYEDRIPKLDVSFIINELGFQSKEELLNLTRGL